MKYVLKPEEYDNIENYIEILSKRNDVKIETLYKLFMILLDEDFIINKQNISLKQIKKCLKIIAEEKKEKIKEEKSNRYIYSDDYIVNYGIHMIFGKESLKYLNPEYLKEMRINKETIPEEHTIIDKETSQKILQLQYDGRIIE